MQAQEPTPSHSQISWECYWIPEDRGPLTGRQLCRAIEPPCQPVPTASGSEAVFLSSQWTFDCHSFPSHSSSPTSFQNFLTPPLSAKTTSSSCLPLAGGRLLAGSSLDIALRHSDCGEGDVGNASLRPRNHAGQGTVIRLILGWQFQSPEPCKGGHV